MKEVEEGIRSTFIPWTNKRRSLANHNTSIYWDRQKREAMKVQEGPTTSSNWQCPRGERKESMS